VAAAGAIVLASCDGAVLSRGYVADSLGAGEADVRLNQARVQGVVTTSAASPAVPRDLLPIGRRDVVPTMVIRTGQASVEVDSLEPAVALIRALAARVGGYVANTEMQTGRGQLRAATIELKIPADRFDEALAGLPPIGKLESVNVTAEDVGEEFVDVTARMTNSRRLEARLIDLLAARTGKLKDVLDVEQELARVREEIERYEGRLRYLKAHAAFSTLTVAAHEHIPVVGRAGSSVLSEAFKQAWRNFVDLLAAFIRSLGVLVPLGVVATAGWSLVRRRLPAMALSRPSSPRSAGPLPGSVPGDPAPPC
jgi:hypothetical protein